MVLIIGITGTIGAGKGAVVEYLVSQKEFAHFAVRRFITEELKRRGLPADRDAMAQLANNIRAEHGPAHIAVMLLKEAAESPRSIIESIRTPAEAEAIRNAGGIILSVDADRTVRYERIVKRGSVTDSVDFKTFVAQEERELTSTDPAKQNVLAVIEAADYHIENNGTLEELHAQLDEFCAKLGI